MGETVPPRDVYTNYTSHGASRLDEISVVRRWGENRGCGIYRSPSGISANEAGSRFATTRLGPTKNKHVTFERYN